MNHSSLEEYFEALSRIINGKPIRTDKGAKITKNLVSLEAGRGKGSIKKSRPIFEKLILAINEAQKNQELKANKEDKLTRANDSVKNLRLALDAALARELSLLYELYEVKRKLSALTGEKVIPFRPNAKSHLSDR